MEKSILMIHPPVDNETGKYVLIVTRSSGLMGGTNTVGFAVDRLTILQDTKGRGYAIAAIREPAEVVTEFPLGTAYLLVLREKVSFYTPVEAATKHKEEEDAVGKIYDSKHGTEEATELPGGAVLFPGETQPFPDRAYR